MVCVSTLLGTPVRFNVGRKNSPKVGQLPNSSRHRLTFRMLPSERAICGADRGGHHCRGRLVEVSAHEEKQALLYRQPHLRGVREICGIGEITG